MFSHRKLIVIVIAVSMGTTVRCNGAMAGRKAPSPEPEYKPDEIIVKFHKPLADALEAQLSEGKAVADLKLTAALDNLNRKYEVTSIEPLVKNFKQKRQRIENLLKKNPLSLTPSERHLVRRLKRAPKGIKVPEIGRIYKLELESLFHEGQSLDEVVAAYNSDPNVEYAELNYIVSIYSVGPNDPCYPIQWALANTGQIYPSNGRDHEPPGIRGCDIDANEAWDITTGSSDIIVAVIDSGVDYNHRDLQNNMWTDTDGRYGYDFCNDDNDPMDDCYHGTHCAGIIAADSNNGLDIAGVSWNAKIMALKFLNRVGSGYTSDAIVAFAYAVDNGADITSNSWGGGPYEQPLQDAIDYAYSQGVITVAAAGNDNSNLPDYYYPACYDHVIAVAATDSNDQRAIWPSVNKGSNYGNWVDIAAPGDDILSLRANGTSMGSPVDDYTTVASGTSMACPHVAGACALLLSVNPYMTPNDANDILLDTVDVVFEPNDHICASNGRLNVYKALLAAVPSKGYVNLDRDYYNCNCNIGTSLADRDLKGQGTQDVNITCGSDLETITLTETGPNTGIFTGTISTASGDPNTGDSILQVSHDETITVTYEDANDGTGNPTTATDTAMVDCVPPSIISNVTVNVMGPDVTVTFETDEYTLGRVLYGLSCGEPYNNSNVGLPTTPDLNIYNIKLTEISSWTDYHFIVEATDRAGNKDVDNNNGYCYQFSTDGPNDFNVPGDFNSIQEAINYSWDGGTVTVSPGTYNEIINFKSRAITVKSTYPNDWGVVERTIVDSNSGCFPAFLFVSGEDANSVISGLTVKGRNQIIWVENSDPTISNCIVEGVYGDTDGSPCGIMCWCGSPIIQNNIIRGVYGILSYRGEILSLGNGIHCLDNAAVIKNNLIYANATGISARSYSRVNTSTIANNTIAYNLNFGIKNMCRMTGMDSSEVMINNCILWGNDANDLRSVNVNNSYWPLKVTYSCIEDGFDANDPYYTGCIDSDPCFVNICDFIDKTDANGTKTTIVLADANLYEVNDVIEYNNDGAIRTVTDVNLTTSKIIFTNPLDANSTFGVLICNWGPDANELDEDFHLGLNSPCIDSGDPNGDYDFEADIDGQPRIMVTRVDMGADEAGYMPTCHPHYNEWISVGMPFSWCYPRQCHGDADGHKLDDPNDPNGPYWVQQNDMDILLSGWQKPYSGNPILDPWIAADFDHAKQGNPKTGYYRVSFNDLNILTAYWKLDPDPNCLVCP